MTLTINHDFAVDKTLVARAGPTAVITRSSIATYFDSAGLLQDAASGIARFDHDFQTLKPLGITVEPETYNYALYSEDFSNAVWVKDASITKTLNYGTSPRGTTTSCRLEYAGGNTTTFFYQGAPITGGTSGKTMTSSIFVRGTGTFRVSNGHGGVAGQWSGDKVATASWVRYEITHTNAASAGNGAQNIGIAESTGDVAFDIEVFAPQCEERARASSYMPATTAAARRRNDQVKVVFAGGEYNDAGGTLFVSGSTKNLTSETYLAEVSAGLPGNRWRISRNVLEARSQSSTAGSTGISVLAAAWTGKDDETQVSCVAGLELNTLQIHVDGVAGNIDSVVDVLTPTPTQISIGSRYDTASLFFDGHISKLQYYNELLSLDERADMSNNIFPSSRISGVGLGFGKMGRLG